MNKKFEKLGFYPADILLPKGQDMTKWAVVACDQFTSEPEYWQAVEEKVGDAPSTLRLILPEANLKAPNVDEYIENINDSMKKYLADGVFETLTDSLIYIERQQSDGRIRHESFADLFEEALAGYPELAEAFVRGNIEFSLNYNGVPEA